MSQSEPTPIKLSDYRAPAWRLLSLELEFDLEASATRVLARMAFERAADAPADAPLELDGDDLKLLSIALDGEALDPDAYRLDAERLVLPSPPGRFALEIATEIDPAGNSKLEGLYLSGGVFCTQCEAEGFRRITFFPDRPDVMTVYRTTIRATAAACPVLLSNGNLVDRGKLPDGRHFAVWDDPHPKPSYLFALVAGDLAHVEDRFRTMSGREVTLRIYVEHGNESRCAYALDALKRSMRWDEERYGFEYDLDLFNIVAVSDFNMGAMENKSLSVFNAKYILADPETATDRDYALIEGIVAHEYFHNWTGNRITCRDWFQLSLKEGLTVFRDQQFSAEMRSAPVQRIQDVRALRARQFPEDAGPLAHPVRPESYIEINNFYTATVYEKGAEIIHMLHGLLGEEGYAKGIRLYVERHDGEAATCDDFVAAMASANGRDLSQFTRWYSQAGTPEIRAEGHYDADSASYSLTLRQETPPTPGQPEKHPLHLPFALGLLDGQGRDLPLRLDGENAPAGTSRTLELTAPEQTFRFVDIPEAPVVSLNRGFSAPVKTVPPAQSDAVLMAHDSDPFNRWEAAQRMGTAALSARIGALRGSTLASGATDYVGALGSVLAQDGDAALQAEMLVLPSEDYLAEQMTVIDVDAIHEAREGLRREIAARFEETLRARYRDLASDAPYSPDAAAAGRRQLRNCALGYLAALETSGTRDLLMRHYREADNMTDRMAALALIADIDMPEREVALADFYGRYESDALVIDKWFQVQATSALPGTLARVAALLAHPAFTLANPNRARALIGAFVSGNPRHFHAADGGGYAFLADRVLEIDPRNPQLAARLLTPMGRWRRFDAARQARMRETLERIVATDGLSKDVFEIASKTLAD